MDGLKLKHSSFLGLGDWKEGNSDYSGHYGGSSTHVRILSWVRPRIHRYMKRHPESAPPSSLRWSMSTILATTVTTVT